MNPEVLRVLNHIRGIYASYPLSIERKNIDEAIDRLMQVYVEILFNDGNTVLERINSSGTGSSNDYFNVQPIVSDEHSGVYALLEGLRKVYEDNAIINILKTTLEKVSSLLREKVQAINRKSVKYSQNNATEFRVALKQYATSHGMVSSDNLTKTSGGSEIWLTDNDFLVAAKMFNVCVVIIDENTNTKPPIVKKRVLHPNLSIATGVRPLKKIIDVTLCEKTIYIGHRIEAKSHIWELLIPTEALNKIIKDKRLNPPS